MTMRHLRSPLVLLLPLVLFACSSREAFYGAHQSGITTPGQKFAFVAAFDLTTTQAEEVRGLFKVWTRLARALTQGLALGDEGKASIPPSDTGEVLGYKPARLTLTFGVGPSLFDHRFSLESMRPTSLTPLPLFAGDQLRPEWSDGDLVVQVGADDYQTAYHALHTLTRAAKGVAVVRWVQDGFQPGLEVNASGPARNLQGFLDGTVNPDPHDAPLMDRVVWAASPDWMKGGSYLVVRRIRMFVEVWDRTSLEDQQRTIGRDRAQGQELPAMSPESHVLVARGGGVEKILRRPFHYVNGLDPRTGQWDSGLLFLAWMKDPRLQFVPMQTRISSFDRLNEYIQVQGSAVFAAFPGVEEGHYLGETLFPDPPLMTRIEALLGAVGQAFPALNRLDWAGVHEAAATWSSLWSKEPSEITDRRRLIEEAFQDWVGTLAADQPNPTVVRSAQTRLVQALEAWQKDVAPRPRSSTADLQRLKDTQQTLAQTVERKGEEAKVAFEAFRREWALRETLVRNLDAEAYGRLETLLTEVRLAINAGDPRALAAVQALGAELAALQPPATFGAWDAGFLLFREGLEALLVLAALLAFLGKTGQSRQTSWVWAGAATGLLLSIAAALAVSILMAGWVVEAPELIEGLAGLLAVVLMVTVGAWLHSKAQVKDWNLWLKAQTAKTGGRGWAMGTLALVAVLREGAETLVFFWGLAGSISPESLMWGVGGALAVLAVLGVVMIGFSKRLPLPWFFTVATALLSFLAVKILGQSLGALQTVGWIPSTPLGFGAAFEPIGFTPTWQTALPQGILFLALATTLLWPWIHRKKGT